MPDSGRHQAHQVLVHIATVVTNYACDSTHRISIPEELKTAFDLKSLKALYISERITCCPKSGLQRQLSGVQPEFHCTQGVARSNKQSLKGRL